MSMVEHETKKHLVFKTEHRKQRWGGGGQALASLQQEANEHNI